MEKRKRWHFYLIIGVLALTLYNILPTINFYSKPLKKPVDAPLAATIEENALRRVDSLKQESLEWLKSFNKLLGIKAKSITSDGPLFKLSFAKEEDAKRFATFLPRAGSSITFVPAQLALGNCDGTEVTVHRNVVGSGENLFAFAKKDEELYREIIADRALELGLAIGGPSENAELLKAAISGSPQSEEFLTLLGQNIVSYAKTFGENSPLTKRLFATFSQGATRSHVEKLASAFEQLKDSLALKRIEAGEEATTPREKQLAQAASIVKKQIGSFVSGATPWDYASLKRILNEAFETKSSVHVITVGSRNPLINAIAIDWANETISLQLHDDVIAYKEGAEKLLYGEVARIGRLSGEELIPYRDEFQITLNTLTNSASMSVLKLGELAKLEASEVAKLIQNEWHPQHQDLSRDVFPIYDYATYQSLPEAEKKLGLIVFAPGEYESEQKKGYRGSSLYVMAKGTEKIISKLRSNPDSPYAKQFMADLQSLQLLLKNSGFIGYPSGGDFIFEKEEFYNTFLHATRENFTVHGTKRYATLEYTNTQQRLLTLNKIETQMHEDLLKWRDEHRAALVNPDANVKYSVPAPTKNVLLSNLKLNAMKYFRGDDRKVLHWGLDLSGGKTVQIELRDQNNRVVTDEADLNQGINELYNRVNKMGVSEVSIRREGSNITLDFPSAQGLSASDLVKASSMYFHVVNEQFSPRNAQLAAATNQFLQDVWNEAVVTGKTGVNHINQIAWRHLYGEGDGAITDSAKTLYDAGLRLAHPDKTLSTNDFDQSFSKIAIHRGESLKDWEGQTTPLLIVFNNYALEGSNLQNVHGSYDPTQGNFLVFEVKSHATSGFETWTAPFAKSSVQGTLREQFGRGGWRMAVILNGSVISSPNLLEPLKNRASITGQFTQREISLLEADLKAGSLTYAPHILSEKNVSPELGVHDRVMGIFATILALVLVVAVMIGYYRFAGVVASAAVLVNLAIMWAALQNIQATITLAGIAGVILTLGMAVDANVLVFERIREELGGGATLFAAIKAGYKKAFSAIFDSNLTTIIAALILLNFDSGPIKGFAITLIIGIVSSMFTALFMTRYFFTGWAAKGKAVTLKMASLIKETTIDFLKYGKIVISASLLVALVGGFLLAKNRSSMFGMDFTGGYSLALEIEPSNSTNYRVSVENALEKAGLSSQEFQARELTPTNSIKLLLSRTLDEEGHPFNGMPLESANADDLYSYMKNPRIEWVVNALQNDGLTLTHSSLVNLDSNWTSVSGQMSDAMRTNALLGLGLALLCILAYITFRFEFKYAVSATLGLAFDLSVAIGLLAILNTLGVPIQIDLNTIAALMTIIGYSLNDTIIIFDRIREDLRKGKKGSFADLINTALNGTLSRTVMTSTTTLVVLLALVSLGGSTIFGLALVMIIGVVYGTLSSLTVAAPLLLFFHGREKQAKIRNLSHEQN